MTEPIKELIKKSLLEGDDRHATRRRLISEGFPSTGFEGVYTSTLKELGIAEPKPSAPKRIPSGEVAPGNYRVRTRNTHYMQTFIFFIIMAALAVALWYVAPGMKEGMLRTIDSLAGVKPSALKETSEDSGSYNMGESIIRTKVDATFASARIYKGKLLDYQGACTGVSVVPPVQCKENVVSLVIYAPLADGRFYCVDSSGGSGERVNLQGETYRCE